MENSIENKINNTPDKNKITIKVKVAGEDYNDVLIDFSDGQDAGRQLFQQLASITGIPFNNISAVAIERHPNRFDRAIVNRRYQPIELNEIARLKLLNDGDCYAVSMCFFYYNPEYVVPLYLINRANFDDNQCTPWFCRHINGRDLLNRRIEIIKYGESKFRKYYNGDLRSALKEMDIQHYMFPVCSLHPETRSLYRSDPYYIRTRG